jgi:DNA polymerase/3'-5' exonuclease PolX
MDHKPRIIEVLGKLRERDFAKNDKWKVRAYDIVIKQLKSLDKPIKSIKDVEGLKGVGDKIKIKIEEIINTGDLAQVRNIDKEVGIITELTKVFGIGPIRARDLYEKHGINSIAELESRTDLLNDKQIMGLKYYKDFEKRIPYKEMQKHDEFLKKVISQIDSELRIEIMGSYRRRRPNSGDIDCLVCHPGDIDHSKMFEDIVKKLESEKYLVDTFAKGNKKYNGVCRLKYHRTNRRIDLMYTSKETFPFALLYFTGSQEFNIALRNKALEKGYSLSEYGLKDEKTGNVLNKQFETEEDVFKFLGLRYVKPENREKVKLELLA